MAQGVRRETAGPLLSPNSVLRTFEKACHSGCDLLGFNVAYDRPDARFAYLVRGHLQVMLCERNGRWEGR